MRVVTLVIVLLQLYFMLMNVTVEHNYCQGPLVAGDSRFLVQDTIAFCQKYNPLFLSRPDWMVKATCMSAYGFFPFYLVTLYACFSGQWKRCSWILSAFVGLKVYALTFYHWMEFTSALAPKELIPYFAVEGPYLLSLALVASQIWASTTSGAPDAAAKRK